MCRPPHTRRAVSPRGRKSSDPTSQSTRRGADRRLGPWERVGLVLLALHLAALAAHHGLGLPYRHKAVFLFHADFERNLPTLFSVLLLLRAGWVCVHYLGGAQRSRWDRAIARALGVVFVFLAADEALALHERLSAPVRQLLEAGALGETALASSALLTFAWILPYGVMAGVLSLLLLGWLGRLPPPIRRGLVLSAALYLGGALGLEAVGGWWIAGDLARRDLVYDLIVTGEEFLEMGGLLLFARVACRLPGQPP